MAIEENNNDLPETLMCNSGTQSYFSKILLEGQMSLIMPENLLHLHYNLSG